MRGVQHHQPHTGQPGGIAWTAPAATNAHHIVGALVPDGAYRAMVWTKDYAGASPYHATILPAASAPATLAAMIASANTLGHPVWRWHPLTDNGCLQPFEMDLPVQGEPSAVGGDIELSGTLLTLYVACDDGAFLTDYVQIGFLMTGGPSDSGLDIQLVA